MNIEIKPVGEKLRVLRKQLNLKQDDLVKHVVASDTKGSTFTRNLVSMVETNKAPLTKKMAKNIYDNIVYICKKNKIPIDFDFEEVCKSEEAQVIEHVDNYKKNIAANFPLESSLEYASTLISLCEKYRLTRDLSLLYVFLGNLCYNENKNLSIKYFISANATKTDLTPDEELSMIYKLKNSYYSTLDFRACLDIAIPDTEISEMKKNCLFIDILCHCILDNLDTAIDLIAKLKPQLQPSDNLNVKITMIETNILIKRNENKKCIEIFEKLLKKNLLQVDRIMILKNLVDLKLSLGINTSDDLKCLESEIIPDELITLNKALVKHTLALCYKSSNKEKFCNYLLSTLELLCSIGTTTSEVSNRVIEILESVLYSQDTFSSMMNDYEDQFKLLIHTIIEKDILDQKNLLRLIYHFMNSGESNFIEKLIERKIS